MALQQLELVKFSSGCCMGYTDVLNQTSRLNKMTRKLKDFIYKIKNGNDASVKVKIVELKHKMAQVKWILDTAYKFREE